MSIGDDDVPSNRQSLGHRPRRSRMKKEERLAAKMKYRAFRKCQLIIPQVSKMLADTALVVEKKLPLKVKLSNMQNKAFVK